MRSLYVRIWLTVVAALGLYAGVSAWLVQRHVSEERQRNEAVVQARAEAWADLLIKALPPATASSQEQVEALTDWSQRLRLPLALDDAQGRRLGASESYLRRESMGITGRRVRLEDGRTLWIARGPMAQRAEMGKAAGGPMSDRARAAAWMPEGWRLAALLGLMWLAVAAGAWPVVRRLTSRLERLQAGVETLGRGEFAHRVPEEGRDEVASLARSFNEAAARIENLLRSHQSLLANASHELRSPLTRLKMAVSLWENSPAERSGPLVQEIHTNIAELDALVEEVLLASRLDSSADALHCTRVDWQALVSEEAARTHAQAQGPTVYVLGDERLLRRAVRNLLENARRYGEGDVWVHWHATAEGGVELWVDDRGPGVPEAFRERIFEAFFRLPGHAEKEGGTGLGLSLVRQIAQRHGGQVHCESREGGGSRFVLRVGPQPSGRLLG